MLSQCPGGELPTAWKSGSPLAWHREAGGWRGTQPAPGWELAKLNGIGPGVPRKVGIRLFLEALKVRRGLKLI